MKKFTLAICLASFAFLSIPALPAPANVVSGLSREDRAATMPVSALKRGMRGYGLTVFHGTKVEKFDFVILGFLRRANTGKDLIIVRVGGGPITARKTGVIAGMSGSPCYVNGKLIGAVSYGSSFSREPVGMLTPIADMLEAWDDALPTEPVGAVPDSPLDKPVSIGSQTFTRVSISAPGDASVSDPGLLQLRPLMTPLTISGMSSRGISRLADTLRRFRLEPVAGTGGGRTSGPNVKLEPGAALGVQLATGDIDITGVGTLTYIRGDRLVAFGHPMLGIGAVDIPMCTAYVEEIMSGYMESSKMASPMQVVGRLFQDRPWSIAGRMGEMPKMIPVEVRVDDISRKRSRVFYVKVINHPLICASLIRSVISEAIFQVRPAPGNATAEVSYDVVADGIGSIHRTNTFFDDISIDQAATADAGQLVGMLSDNGFKPVAIKSVKLAVKLTDRVSAVNIERAYLDRSSYMPGQSAQISVVMRPYLREPITRTFTVKIPDWVKDGPLVCSIRGGNSPGGGGPSASLPGGGPPGGPMAASGLAEAETVPQLVSKYLEREKNSQLSVRLMVRNPEVIVNGVRMSGLPLPFVQVFASPRNSGIKMAMQECKTVFDTDMVLFGGAQVQIDVRKNQSENGGQPPRSGPPMPGGGMPSLPPGMPMPPVPAYYYGDDESTWMASTDAGLPLVTAPMPGPGGMPGMPGMPSIPGMPGARNGAAQGSQPSPSTKTAAKTVVRQMSEWSTSKQQDFARGEFSGTCATSEDKLTLAPKLGGRIEIPADYAWCVLPTKEGPLVGTGNGGKVYRAAPDGAKVFFETGAMEVHALVKDSQGRVIVGTSPKGEVFRVGPDGKGALLCKLDTRYVLAMVIDSADSLYCAAGDSGRVFKVTPDGKATLYAETGEQQVASLAWAADGALLVGTGTQGAVYRVVPGGGVSPVFCAGTGCVTALANGPEKSIYAAMGGGATYKISATGIAEALGKGDDGMLSTCTDKQGRVYLVTGDSVSVIYPDGSTTSFGAPGDRVEFTGVAYDPDTDTILATTSGSAALYSASLNPAEGVYESSVFDTGAISKWGRLGWRADAPDGASVTAQTRCGNVPEPDSSWTAWSAASTSPAGADIPQIDARYVQYRLAMKSAKPGATPSVSAVTITYLTPNHKPSVKLALPVGGEAWSGKKNIKWAGADPDKDTVNYDVSYSGDGGATWKLMAGPTSAEAKPAEEAESPEDPPKPDDEPAEPPKPDSAATAKPGTKPEAASASKPAPKPSSQGSKRNGDGSSEEWDTSTVPDGKYRVKIAASDKPSNPVGFMTDEAVSAEFIICNKAPVIRLDGKDKVEVKAADQVVISGSAQSAMVTVAGVQYKIDSGMAMAAEPADGLFDSGYETFRAALGTLTPGKHKITIEAADTAGNSSSETVEITVK